MLLVPRSTTKRALPSPPSPGLTSSSTRPTSTRSASLWRRASSRSPSTSHGLASREGQGGQVSLHRLAIDVRFRTAIRLLGYSGHSMHSTAPCRIAAPRVVAAASRSRQTEVQDPPYAFKHAGRDPGHRGAVHTGHGSLTPAAAGLRGPVRTRAVPP